MCPVCGGHPLERGQNFGNARLITEEIPARTDGRAGFFHLLRSRGTVEEAELVYNLRDFERDGTAPKC